MIDFFRTASELTAPHLVDPPLQSVLTDRDTSTEAPMPDLRSDVAPELSLEDVPSVDSGIKAIGKGEMLSYSEKRNLVGKDRTV